MPTIICPDCGKTTYLDPEILHYDWEIACKYCFTKMKVKGSTSKGIIVTRMRFSLRGLEQYWDYLSKIEQERLEEAVYCSKFAPTACESMCFDALCSLLRRLYGEKKELGYYTKKMEKDPNLSDLSGAISYFYHKRNQVDHPERTSNPLEAESTFSMTKRLILGIFKNKPDFVNRSRSLKR